MGGRTDAIEYRLARPSDADAIAALHAHSWRRSFRGIFSDTYLDHEADADRARVWRQRLHHTKPNTPTVTIVAEADGELLGFIHSFVEEDPQWGTFLDNLHVRHDSQRLGIGKQLMRETVERLENIGSDAGVYLWALEANEAAQCFYDALGGHVAESRSWDIPDGGQAPSLRYTWLQLADLARHLFPERHRD